jgi:hypothetical protein
MYLIPQGVIRNLQYLRRILEHWAVLLQAALTILLIALLFETSWPIAYVYVLSVPSGATVYDGEGFYWTTPAQIPVPHQGLPISVSHSGRMSMDTLITPAMASSPVLVNLQYLFPLTVTSEPSGASFFLDGSLEGVTPSSIVVNEPGLHRIRLVLDEDISVADSFILLENSPDTLHYSLPTLAGGDMVLIPRGVSGEGNPDHSYLISRHEITNSQFSSFLRWLEPSPVSDSTNRWGRTDVLENMFPGDYPVHFFIGPGDMWTVQPGFEDHPVAGLTYHAAMDYCSWLSQMNSSGLIYRLPTAGEWETAALASGGGPWPWGSQHPDGRLLNLSDSEEGILRRHPSIDDGFSATAPVGSYPPNGWDLYDMAGNVWEYCLPTDSLTGPVAMGGSWPQFQHDCGRSGVLE